MESLNARLYAIIVSCNAACKPIARPNQRGPKSCKGNRRVVIVLGKINRHHALGGRVHHRRTVGNDRTKIVGQNGSVARWHTLCWQPDSGTRCNVTSHCRWGDSDFRSNRNRSNSVKLCHWQRHGLAVTQQGHGPVDAFRFDHVQHNVIIRYWHQSLQLTPLEEPGRRQN